MLGRAASSGLVISALVMSNRTCVLCNGFSVDMGACCGTLSCYPTGSLGAGTGVGIGLKTLCNSLGSFSGTVGLVSGTASACGILGSSSKVTGTCGTHNLVRICVGRCRVTSGFFESTLHVGGALNSGGGVTTGVGGLYLCRNSARRGVGLVRRTVIVGRGLGTL